jgi:hypothetical protein
VVSLLALGSALIAAAVFARPRIRSAPGERHRAFARGDSRRLSVDHRSGRARRHVQPHGGGLEESSAGCGLRPEQPMFLGTARALASASTQIRTRGPLGSRQSSFGHPPVTAACQDSRSTWPRSFMTSGIGVDDDLKKPRQATPIRDHERHGHRGEHHGPIRQMKRTPGLQATTSGGRGTGQLRGTIP